MALLELYRYQLLPLSQYQVDFFADTLSAEQIRERKNEFFDNVLSELPTFIHRGLEIQHKVLIHSGTWFVFKLGAHKSVRRTKPDFEDERIDDWPNVTVIINNDPAVQIIAISPNIKAFTSTATVAKIIERSLSTRLRSFGLSIEIREQFDKQHFWDLIENYAGRITRVRFEMVSPNMANISRVLKIDLKQLNRDTNCLKTAIALEAGTDGKLEISKSNELIDGCVDYASQGGGDIAVKIKGIKKEIRTSRTIRTVEIDEIYFQGPSERVLDDLLSVIEP